MNKAIFLDRDGVINRGVPEGEYITCREELQYLPGVPEAIGLLNRSGFLVIVVTNQRCVAKGLITAKDLKELHKQMCNDLALAGGRIDKVYCCPHDLQPPCSCRKPAPGMLLDAAQEQRIALPESWMIGDSVTDIEAGKRAGCKTALIASTNRLFEDSADVTAPSLHDAVGEILIRSTIPTERHWTV